MKDLFDLTGKVALVTGASVVLVSLLLVYWHQEAHM